MTRDERRVIVASSVGTIFEWYDFFLYGALATIIGAKFFSPFDESTRNIFALLTFALGFLVRPFGALVFGRFGDLFGRKYIFLTTIAIMGASTLIVGLLPTSDQIGIAAPIILVALRILQGLAISGEFGGAAIYVAEHAPPGRRGFYTGWIPACIAFSLLLSLAVILLTQSVLDDAQFKQWGWRIPFLASALLLVLSLWIRLRLKESPAFLKMKAEGRQSRAPVREALGRWRNIRLALIALFGMSTATAVLGYTGTFYTLVFLTSTLKVDGYSANLLFATAMILGAAGCVFFAWLSDHIGRKPIILAGCAIAVVAYFGLFHALAELVNPALYHAQRAVPVSVNADPATCSFQFNPAGTAKFTSPCDVAKATLARASVAYANVRLPAGAPTTVTIGRDTVTAGPSFAADLAARVKAAGYPAADDPAILRLSSAADLLQGRSLQVIGLLLVLVLLAQMAQGPAAAGIVELFPTNIRYTAMSLPYQIGTGWIGGLLPATMFAMNAESGNMFFGLWYPIAFAASTFVVGLFFLPETSDRDIAS
ncbi:MFS transporter [Bradyrhizobium sp. U87765 SZCCT0131]|uniref:MFS transporter n=1 Tax=unclassified Bradyrhizobium TaxID=2631580 RepID=UPI001BA4E59F|nr:MULTISPECIES: MFS transporter [unclassified Bradyrhizobium]MBR1219011.1 MFS transporter [Bradyrhizobium sp. U87765 SZCCT0131]MBR1261662.1 MFS transporter [Bradyrhizobium sp. U87765 SZCCT0134]MBR1306485.1 MFS transporter [Bradyrhizobium sp. U87765 SZCCT0110]MBR1317444.1 MFS transporter [Bradyrhizobium sp. U87765 SZCCT0109]MBR1351146.1 MFS transporter [Bradyrhizobium sp. U87765 SZCCT0048]